MTTNGLTPDELRRLEGEAEKMVGERGGEMEPRTVEVRDGIELGCGYGEQEFYLSARETEVHCPMGSEWSYLYLSHGDLEKLRAAITELLGEEKP